jgi:hypothetical protein
MRYRVAHRRAAAQSGLTQVLGRIEFSGHVIEELSLMTSTSAILSATLDPTLAIFYSYLVDLKGLIHHKSVRSNLNVLDNSSVPQAIRC